MILVLATIIILLLINLIIVISLNRLNFESKNEINYVNISVIIAAKNEAENIAGLIQNLKDIEYPAQKFEIIIVDDNSVDETLKSLQLYSSSLENLSVIPLNKNHGSGKRDALSYGILNSKNDHILITDADCTPEKDWLTSFSRMFSNGFDLVFGIAPYYQHETLLNNISCFENLRNSILSFSMALIGLPYSAAARKFGFRKKAFNSIGGYLHTKDTLSGDDDLLIREAVKGKLKIGITADKNSYVYSESKKTFSEYFLQKARHTQTSFHYLLQHQIALGFWHLMNLAFLFSPLLMIIDPVFGIMLPLKFLVDVVIVKIFQKNFGYKFSTFQILYLQIVYEFFLIVHFINARFTKIRWK